MGFFDQFNDRSEFFFARAIDLIIAIVADHWLVGWNFGDFEFIDLGKFAGFGHGRAGHAGKFGIEPEVVLESD